jgi:hypothetical protein
MKEHLRTIIQSAQDRSQARNLAREYLQARILASLQSAGAMIPLAFHGGTALRFLYALPRYSEDLDFALERTDGYDFRAYLHTIRSELYAEGYTLELKVNDQRTVQSAFVRFVGLLYDLGLTPHRDEVISVKLEVDTNPPQGAELETTLIRRLLTLQIQHHDKASLLAGKLHAVLQRPYIKGRDIYDLLWYLSDPKWPEPNLRMLNNALAQSGWQEPPLTPSSWRNAIILRLEGFDWHHIQQDVAPFIERSSELQLLTLANFRQLL